MSNNYGETICTAIDEIVTAKLQGLQYDITKLCTIVDDEWRDQGKYTVSDGSVRFDAYSSITNYREGNTVLVNIPNGDFNMQKTIVGRQTSTQTQPFTYTSPLDTMIRITDNTLESLEVGKLTANSNGINEAEPASSVTSKICTMNYKEGECAGFTRLGIGADFKTLLNGQNVLEGNYGLRVLVYSKASDNKTDVVYELTFSSEDMYGNPYNFESYFNQEKVFDISVINNITNIDVYFYQSGNFKDGNSNPIQWRYDDNDLDVMIAGKHMPSNLFVDNVKIYLGYDKDQFTQDTLMLYTPNALTYWYKRGEDERKNIYLRWIHKIGENDYRLLKPEDFPKEGFCPYEVMWFKYTAGAEDIDKYAGVGWQRINQDAENPLEYSFMPDFEQQTEKIKVIGLIKEEQDIEEDGVTLEKGTPYFSNVLEFENEEDVPDQTTLQASSALAIICKDNSEGNYFVYDQNGRIINEGVSLGYRRDFDLKYKGHDIDEQGVVDYIEWWFPSTTTMLNLSEEWKNENHGIVETQLQYKGVSYFKIRREKPVEETGKISTVQPYSIGRFWAQSNSNNTIRCVVSINGVTYEAVEELRFGKAGTTGTNYTFVLDFEGNKNALTLGTQDDVLQVKAHLYDSSGEQLIISGVEWSWAQDSSHIIMTTSDGGDGTQVPIATLKLNNNVTELPTNNYHVIQCDYKMEGYTLTAFLPIPIRLDDSISYIEGAREVIYDHQGNPSYYNNPYKVYQWDKDKLSYNEIKGANNRGGIPWQIQYDDRAFDEEDNKASDSYKPILKDVLVGAESYQALCAAPFYAKGYNDRMCVSCQYWSQPLLVMQSEYDFAMLNSWDGTLTLDENNGTILSTMLGAGKKDEDNKFSGVLIGDIKGGTGNDYADTQTGVYGLSGGVISYALRENGTAVFGKKGNGQIFIDGSNSQIRSANYYSKTGDSYDKDENGNFIVSGEPGTLIDLNNGMVDIKGKLNEGIGPRITIQPRDPYLKITSVAGNELMRVGDGDSNYYLRSDNWLQNKGANFDLNKGIMTVRSEYGQIFMSGGEEVYDPILKKNTKKYFEIAVPEADQTAGAPADYINKLFLLSDEEYYLQSSEYSTLGFIQVEGLNTYTGPDGYIVALTPDGKNVRYVNGNSLGEIKQFESSYVEYENEKGETIREPISAERNKQIYIEKLVPRYVTGAKKSRGFKMDLKNSSIIGYDLLLKGTSDNGEFVLDSGAPEYPFTIGNDFKVNWDGELTCSKVESLNDDGRNQYSISINENFYVTKSGAAGGGSASFGSGSFGSGSMGGVGFGGGGSINAGHIACDSITCGGKIATINLEADNSIGAYKVECNTITATWANLENAGITSLDATTIYTKGGVVNVGEDILDLKRRVSALENSGVPYHTHSIGGSAKPSGVTGSANNHAHNLDLSIGGPK